MSSTATTPGEAQDDFYDATPLEPQLLYQGEILVDVPILNMPKPSRWLLLRTARTGRRVNEALENGAVPGTVRVLDSNQSREQWYGDGLGDFAMAQLDKKPVLVLSQTCDIQNKDFIQIAPILPVAPIGEQPEENLEGLKNGDVINAFWLKPHAPEIQADSFADLTLMQAIHASYVRRLAAAQHFRLNPARTRLLQQRITRYFGRPNSFDAQSDRVPRTGTYLCVACFYMDGAVSAVPLDENADFPMCTTCGGPQWVLKGR